MIFPPALQKGDAIAVFAGSSPFDRTLVLRGMGFLAERYRVVFEPSVFARKGYLAGTDRRRAAELATWMRDVDVRAMVAARGGWGLLRAISSLPWDAFAASPKWVLGFSDVTTLHLELQARGFASLHGPNAAAVGRADLWTRERVIASLESPTGAQVFDGLRVVSKGTATGPLVGGNLTLIHAHAAAGRLRLPDGALLLLEDVTERPYRIDRMLTALRLAGVFDRVAGVVLGEWTDCPPGADRVTVDAVLDDALGGLGVPVVAGAPIGHGRWNAPVVLGRPFTIDGTTLTAA